MIIYANLREHITAGISLEFFHQSCACAYLFAGTPRCRIKTRGFGHWNHRTCSTRIVAELEEGGYLKRTKIGRQNKYEINGEMPLRHSQESHRTIKELLDWVEHTTEDTLDEYNVLENWTVGEHGSEV